MNLQVSVFRINVFRSLAAGLLCICVCSGVAQELEEAQLPREVQVELLYINKLFNKGMADWAEKVTEDLAKNYPGVDGIRERVKALRVKGYILQGKWEEAKQIIAAEPDQESSEVWAMKLEMARGLFAFQRFGEARGIYESFFNKYPDGPTKQLNSFYRDSAYEYAKMLLMLDQREAAVKAFERVLKAKLGPAAKRQVYNDMGEQLVKLAEDAKTGPERTAFLKRAKELIDDLLYGRDVFFGKGIVLLAHTRMIEGKAAEAQQLVDDYKNELIQLDRALEAESEQTGQDLTTLSPMAQCRYLLAVMLQDRASKLMKEAGYDKAEVVNLLAGRRNSSGKRKNGALQHFVTVVYKYPQTPWAPDAGARFEQVKSTLREEFDANIKVDISAERLAEVRRAQFVNASTVFGQNQWEKAAELYRQVLNQYPRSPESLRGLRNLAMCYVELNEMLYAEAVVGHLAERFAKAPELSDAAGDQLLALAMEFQQRKLEDQRLLCNNFFFDYYPDHPRAASTLARFGERRYRAGDMEGALNDFLRVADQYTNSLAYFDAMNRISTIYNARGDTTNELKTLTAYIDRLQQRGNPGVELASARYREADAIKALGVSRSKTAETDEQRASANKLLWQSAERFSSLFKELSNPDSSKASGAEDAQTLLEIKEAALYGRAYALSRIEGETGGKKPAELKQMAISAYRLLVKNFPESTAAPAALTQIGTIYSVMGKPEDAETAFSELREKYPESQQAKNVLFNWGMSLLELGLRNEAKEKFRKMFSEEGNYAPSQIQTAGQELLKVGEYDTALQAFEQVLAKTESRSLVEPAMLGKAQVLMKKAEDSGGDKSLFVEAAKLLDEFRSKYPQSGRTIKANMLAVQAFSEVGSREPSRDKRIDWFNKAVEAMRKVGAYEKSEGGKARASLEVSRLLARKIPAEEKFGTPKSAKEARLEAIGAYQVFVLGAAAGNISDAEVLPHLEVALLEATELLVEAELWQDVYENALTYNKYFSDGRYAPRFATWKARAANKGAKDPE